MEQGLYEKVLDEQLKRNIEDFKNKVGKIDESEIPKVLAAYYEKLIR